MPVIMVVILVMVTTIVIIVIAFIVIKVLIMSRLSGHVIAIRVQDRPFVLVVVV